MRYACSVCFKPERYNEVTGSIDVEIHEIFLDRGAPTRNAFGRMVYGEHVRTRIYAHARCAEQFEEIVELRDILNDFDMAWRDKQRQICKALTRLTNLILPQAPSPDWRPEFMIPEDYYNK